MKRIGTLVNSFLLVCLVLGIMAPKLLQAGESEGESDGFKYTISNNQVTITGLVDQKTQFINIPVKIDGRYVTKIGAYAFLGCTEATKVYFPRYLQRIEEHAFEGCTGLKQINIPWSVEYIGSYAFLDCTGLTTIASFGDPLVIETGTFKGCTSLVDVTTAADFWKIGDEAFMGCISLNHFSIPHVVSAIGKRAFYGCENLTSLDIPLYLKSVDMDAFGNTAISAIKYDGTWKQWLDINISNNDILRKASVAYREKTPPMITQQPVSAEVAAGSEIRLKVVAQGTDLKYQWYYELPGSDTFVKWDGRNLSSFSFYPSEAKNGIRIYCIVTDVDGDSVQSDTVTIKVRPGITITQQPVSVTFEEGQEVQFSIKATGEDLTYQWYYRMPKQDNSQRWEGYTDASFSFKPSYSQNGMVVFCRVTDAYGTTVDSTRVSLTMIPELKILQQPENVNTELGGIVTFSIKAQGAGLKYKWYYKLSGQQSFTSWDGRVGSKFTYLPSARKNGMQVYCVVEDSNGNSVQSEVVTLTIGKELKILQQPEDREVYAGTPIVYSVEAEGDGLAYLWYYQLKGREVAFWGGRTTAEFTFTPSPAKDGMKVYCIVKDIYGNRAQTNTVTLTLLQ